jgi:hypothetical protein
MLFDGKRWARRGGLSLELSDRGRARAHLNDAPAKAPGEPVVIGQQLHGIFLGRSELQGRSKLQNASMRSASLAPIPLATLLAVERRGSLGVEWAAYRALRVCRDRNSRNGKHIVNPRDFEESAEDRITRAAHADRPL